MLVLALVMLFVVSGCVPQPKIAIEQEVVMSRTTYSFDQGKYPSDLDLFPEYQITTGDILDVSYQLERTLQPETRVSLYHTLEILFPDAGAFNIRQEVLPNGTIVMPFIGEVFVLDKTVGEIKEDVDRRMSQTLQDPQTFVRIIDYDVRLNKLREALFTAPRGLSKLVTVRPDGYCTFPLVGDLLVAGLTLPEAYVQLQAMYNGYLNGLKVDLFLHEQTGSVVYVIGEVNAPDSYKVLKPINVIQALTLAKSWTVKAELRNVVVFRQYEDKVVGRIINLHDPLSIKNNAMFFYLRPDDVLYVPKSKIAGAGDWFLQVRTLLMLEGFTWNNNNMSIGF